jgi:hypothetical protein
MRIKLENTTLKPRRLWSSIVSEFWCRIGRFVMDVWPMQRNQRGASLIDRVRHQTESRALEQAKRVPWKRLGCSR